MYHSLPPEQRNRDCHNEKQHKVVRCNCESFRGQGVRRDCFHVSSNIG